MRLLRGALRSLHAGGFREFEVLVADDGSAEGAAVAEAVTAAGARLVRLEGRRGPAAARNAGAARAGGEVLVFLDADTSVHVDTMERFARAFDEDPGLDAVFGAYDTEPSAAGRVSRFRNLLHSFVHQRGNRRASTFWAGCGAVRRERFQAAGGFDESFAHASIEDVEFGLRLHESGGRIALDPRIQVTHHKAWTLASMVRTDLQRRAIPWAGLLRKHGLPRDLNFRMADRLAVGLAALLPLAAVAALRHGGVWGLAAVLPLPAIAALELPLLRFLARCGGWREALAGYPLLLVYLWTCGAGLAAGLALAEHRRDRWFWPGAALTGVLLAVLQIAGGAYRAEFSGHPDEAAHFVSGLMVHDYLASPPRQNPMTWAGQYYLHYPKVAIGHWPPLYYVFEAGWWLVWGPTRASAMGLQWAIGVAALAVLYRLARTALPVGVAAGIVLCTMASPVFQQALEQTMSDLLCLLWGVLVMHASVRLVERQDRASAMLVALWLALAALTKGTAVCLAPVPVLALAGAGKRLRIRLSWAVAGALCVAAAGAWYFVAGGVTAWGGMTTAIPWPGRLIGHLAGWGFLALALFGVGRHPLALAAGGVIVSTVGVSVVVRAMQEPRHWIHVLPAIPLLAGLALQRMRHPVFAAAALTPALLLFPYAWYQAAPTENGALLRQLHRPARMLISSAGFGEGPWIATVAVSERRPSSFVVRASKAMAEEGWNGEGYHLLTPTPAAVAARLDELAIDTVILDQAPGPLPAPAHHVLIGRTMAADAAWKACAGAGRLLAYCRVAAPTVPRRPLRLRIRGWEFEEKIEP